MTENGNGHIECEAVDKTAPTPPAANPLIPVYKKLSQVMGAVGRIEKRGTAKDSSGKTYTYITDEDIYTAVREAMTSAGLILIPTITNIVDDSKPTVVFLELDFVDCDTGQMLTIPWRGKSYNAPDKAISGAVTMALKYALKAMFLIATGDPADDPDSPENAKRNEPADVTPETPARVASNSRRQTVRPHTPAGNSKPATDANAALAEAGRGSINRSTEGRTAAPKPKAK